MLRGSRFVVVIIALVCAGVAVAQDSPALKKLRLFNEDIKRGFTALEGTWGADPAGEAARVRKAEGIAKGIEAALTDDLATAGAPHTRVKQNLMALQGELASARLALAYSVAEQKVRQAHKTGNPAKEEDLLALRSAIKELRAKSGAGWQATIAHFEQRTNRLAKDRATLAGGAPVAIAAVATPPPEAAPAAGALADAMKEANRQMRNVVRHLEDDATSIPDDKLTAFRGAAAKVSALSERAGRYYTTVYRSFLVANAWRTPDEQAFTTLPGLFQGDLLGQGAQKRKLKAVVDAPEGWCVGVVMSFREFSGSEGVKDLEWKHASKTAELLRFDLPHPGPGWQQVQGVCATEAGKLTLSATVDGSQELRWVAIGWPKESLPMYAAEYMRLLPPDRCDDEAWYRAWTRPVPGSLVYVGEEPYLLVSAERPAKDEVGVISVVGERKTLPKSQIASQAPAARKFASSFGWAGCPIVEDARGEAKKLQQCVERIEKKYASSISAEEKRAERAATDTTREKANARIETLRAKVEQERESTCGPIEVRIREKAKRTFDRILDLHVDNPVITHLDRADQLAAEQQADPDLR